MLKKIRLTGLLLSFSWILFAQSPEIPDFPWMKEAGAKQFPNNQKIYRVSAYGAIGDGVFVNTAAIQKAIDEAEANGGGL